MKYFLSAVLLLFVSTALYSQQIKNFQPERPDYKLKGKVSEIEIIKKEMDNLVSNTTVIFNDFGFPEYEIDGNDTFAVYYYDEIGNLKKNYYNKADYKSTRFYEYDANNNMIKQCYDDITLCSEYEWFGNKLAYKGKPDKEYFLFDNKGLLIEQLNYSRKVMKYNNKKELIEETVYDGEKITSSVAYKYNSNGDPIKILSRSMYEPAPRVMNIKYVYDKKGNWVSKEETEEGSSYKVSQIRKITYKEELPAAKSKTKKK